jgi:hypothetical protein
MRALARTLVLGTHKSDVPPFSKFNFLFQVYIVVEKSNDNRKLLLLLGMDEILFHVSQSLEALQVQEQFTEFCLESLSMIVALIL